MTRGRIAVRGRVRWTLFWLLGLPLLLAACAQLLARPAFADGNGGKKRSEADYRLPAVVLVRQDGQRVNFPAAVDDGRPVILHFMYTSCTAICPATTQVFARVQEKLGPDRDTTHMVSISIDPEHDTPGRLGEFARKFNAGPHWNFYTGTLDDSIALQKAFDAYRGDKMNHMPITYLRAAPGKPWVRLDGLVSPDDIVKEYRGLIGNG